MQIKPIKTVKDNEIALARIDKLWDAQPDTEQGDELEVLATLVHAFEEEHYPIKGYLVKKHGIADVTGLSHEILMDKLEYFELAQVIDDRKDQLEIKVNIDDL